MNSRRQTAILYARLVFALLVFAISLVLLIKGASNSAIAHGPRTGTAAQDEEKSLDIDRYPNQPLELVDVKIRANSVKDKIKSKSMDNAGQSGQDNVKFREKNDWFKHMKVRLRNTSGRSIYGLEVTILFKVPNLQVGFRASVKESHTRNLKHQPLQPGEEVELGVDNGSLGQVLDYMQQNGVDPNQTTLRLSVEGVSFGDDFGWRKGSLMRRNPSDPKKWDFVDQTGSSPSPSVASRLSQPAGSKGTLFQPAGYKFTGGKSLFDPVPQDLYRCKHHQAGIQSWPCNGDQNNPCDTVQEHGNGEGSYTNMWVFDLCIYRPGPLAEYCGTFTLHNFLEFDVTCPPPGATPTPLSCLPDTYVYIPGGIPCCSGHVTDGLCGPAPAPSPTPPTCLPNGHMTFGTPCCSGHSVDGICAPNPGPTPPSCIPNGQMTFTTPCCSGYSENGICQPNPSGSPSPPPCSPNGSMCFLPSACCSGNCLDFQCAPAGATPTPPNCQPDGSWCWDPSECCSGNCDDFDFVCYSFGGGGGGGGGGDWCMWDDCGCWYDWECGSFCDWDGFCAWMWLDPILIDINGDGFDMSDAENGVVFDFFGRGLRRKMSWTAAGSDDAWLVLDRNRNGTIDNAREMFSNVTPQPEPPAGTPKIGFAGLAEYDQPSRGANGDGRIDSSDRIFQYLRLWQDVNHNGVSESSELHSLSQLGVESISLDYRESRRNDRWGNVFRYRAKVYGTNKKDLGRWAYDVVLTTETRERGRASLNRREAPRFVWETGLFRRSKAHRLGQIDSLPEGKSFLRQLTSTSSLPW